MLYARAAIGASARWTEPTPHDHTSQPRLGNDPHIESFGSGVDDTYRGRDRPCHRPSTKDHCHDRAHIDTVRYTRPEPLSLGRFIWIHASADPDSTPKVEMPQPGVWSEYDWIGDRSTDDRFLRFFRVAQARWRLGWVEVQRGREHLVAHHRPCIVRPLRVLVQKGIAHARDRSRIADRLDVGRQPSLASVHHHFWVGGRLAVPAPAHATDRAHIGGTTIDDDPDRRPVRRCIGSGARFNRNLLDSCEELNNINIKCRRHHIAPVVSKCGCHFTVFVLKRHYRIANLEYHGRTQCTRQVRKLS